jgi:hypothetical protein
MQVGEYDCVRARRCTGRTDYLLSHLCICHSPKNTWSYAKREYSSLNLTAKEPLSELPSWTSCKAIPRMSGGLIKTCQASVALNPFLLISSVKVASGHHSRIFVSLAPIYIPYLVHESRYSKQSHWWRSQVWIFNIAVLLSAVCWSTVGPTHRLGNYGAIFYVSQERTLGTR